MARFRCSFCRTPEKPWGIEFEADFPQCPRCHAQGLAVVIPVVKVHFYAPDSQGPIVGAGGRHYRVACSPGFTNPNGIPCTGLPSAVTCEACMRTQEFHKAEDLQAELTGGILLE